jgi:hypothetical protein
MWHFILRHALEQAARQPYKRAGSKLAGAFFTDEANGPEWYADRIKRDYRLPEYADAWEMYASDPAYWEKYYNPPPSVAIGKEAFVRDSAAHAGISSRYNTFENEFPEPGSAPTAAAPGLARSPPTARPGRDVFVRESAAAAGVPSRNNVLEHGFPESGSVQPSLMSSRTTRGSGYIGSLAAPPIPFLPAAPPSAPGGIPGLLIETGLNDPLNPDAPPPGGLVGLLQEYFRNNRERGD